MRTEHKASVVHLENGKTITTRSALEARWATFFTEFGLEWKYEPQTFQIGISRQYTPDFELKGIGYIEIKPTVRLLLQENGKRIERLSKYKPDLKFYVICSERVDFDCVALLTMGKIYSLSWIKMTETLCCVRYPEQKFKADAHGIAIHHAMTKANTSKVDHVISTAHLLFGLFENMSKIHERTT